MAFEYLAYITDGATHGSDLFKVEANQSDEVEVLVYAGTELLGSAEIVNQVAMVNLSRAVAEFELVTAYVELFGEKGGPAVMVTGSDQVKTGWQKPSTVNGNPYSAWLAAGNPEIPAIYNPDIINRVVNARRTLVDNDAQIEFQLLLQAGYWVDNAKQVVATVMNPTGTPSGAFLYCFDSGAINNIPSKTYTIEGTYQVEVIDSIDTTIRKTITFPVTLPPSIPAATGLNANIVSVGWTTERGGGSLGNFLWVELVSTGPCEVKVDGMTTFTNGPTVINAPWGVANTNGNNSSQGLIFQYIWLYGIPNGTGVLRARLIGNSSTEVHTTFYM